MTDARWFDVNAEMESAVRHFRRSVELYENGGFDDAGLDGYRAQMALMHALQSAHTSLEGGLVRILEMLGEESPSGINWHADLIKRVSTSMPGRPAILGPNLARAADETRRFRHRATHNYDSFEIREMTRTINAAGAIASNLESEILAFRNIVDPPSNENDGGDDGVGDGP